jgi:hypothetical protein
VDPEEARPEEIDATVADILARDEFKSLQEDSAATTKLIGEMLESMLNAIRALVGDLRANHPGVFVALLVFGTVVIAISVWYGARGAARRRTGEARLGEDLPEVLRGDPVRLRADAELAAAAGRWLEAVRLYFRATIIQQALAEGTLERLRDADAFRRSRTYRELVGEFARNEAQAARMRRIATRIELGLYSGAELGPADWEDARALARELS